MKTGVILNNIGTPSSSRRSDVAAYLDEFLMDPDVVALPYLFRFLLVKGLIVPFRSRSSSKKYQKIWTREGSPLLVYTQGLQRKLQNELGSEFSVKIGMRYGGSSVAQAIRELENENIQDVIFAPLFPQYSEATSGSAIRHFESLNKTLQANFLEAFYDKDFFLEPMTRLLQLALVDKDFDHIVFSYHGLPINQNKGQSEKAYDQQCFETSKLLAQRLALSSKNVSSSFQSRLGPAKWLGPSTQSELERLVSAGKKRIAIACPAFVTDCLESLEEVGIELRQHFLSLGGEQLELIPCLNDNDVWARGLAAHLKSISQK